jgi:hypothetical protein
VPLRIFRSRTLVGGDLVLAPLGMVALGMSLIVSMHAQQVLGYSALEFGLGTTVMTVMALIGSTPRQAIVTRVGVRWVAAVGLLLTGAGCLLLTQVSADGSYMGDIFFGLLVFGPGLGVSYVAASVATLAGVAEAGVGPGVRSGQRRLPDRRRDRHGGGHYRRDLRGRGAGPTVRPNRGIPVGLSRRPPSSPPSDSW